MNTLAFQTKLESNVLQLSNIENLIGKDVIVTIVEIPYIKPRLKRIWNYIGAVQLNGKLDNTNIRPPDLSLIFSEFWGFKSQSKMS